MLAIKIKHIIRISNNFRLKNRVFLNSYEFKKNSARSFCDFFDKDSPYVKEAGDKIYPKVPRGSVEKYMDEIYEEYQDAMNLYTKNDLNSAYTKCNMILNDAMLFKNHILPMFVYNLLGKIQIAQGEIKSAIEKFEKTELYYYKELDLKPENYYLAKNNIDIRAQNEDINSNWQQIIDCIKETLANLGYLYREERKNEKSNEKLIYLLENFRLEKDIEYFKILINISLNFSSLGNYTTAKFYLNKILNEQNEFNVEDDSEQSHDIRDQFYTIIARTYKQIAAIKHFNKEDPKNILTYFKKADVCYDKCVNKEMYAYLNNLFCLGQFSQLTGEYDLSNEYCVKLNENIQSEDEKSFENELNKLKLDSYNLMVVNYSNLENFENLMEILIEYLNLLMKVRFDSGDSQEQNIRNNFLFLFQLFEKNYATVSDKYKITKLIYKCLSQFLNWKLIPEDNIDVAFYEEKLETILLLIKFSFENSLFDSEFVEIIEKAIKKFSVIARSYEDEIKDLMLKINIISINIELIKHASNKNNNLKEKLFTTFFHTPEPNQNLKEINSINNAELNEEIKSHILSNILITEHLVLLIKNIIKSFEKNNENAEIICQFSDKLISYLKEVLSNEMFKTTSEKYTPILNELNTKLTNYKKR